MQKSYSSKQCFLNIVKLIVVFVLLLGGWHSFMIFTPVKLADEVFVIINPGDSTRTVIRKACDAGLFFNCKYALRYTLIKEKLTGTPPFKVSEHIFSGRVSTSSVLSNLRDNSGFLRKITIIEGITNREIANIISQSTGIIDADKSFEILSQQQEGYVLPDTYLYSYGTSAIQLINNMHSALNEQLDDLWQKRDRSIPLATKEEALVLASIVEKETSILEEKGMIASVFYNRLNRKMRLQSDPTVEFAITKGKFKLYRPLSKADLAFVDPYNTYRTSGLPPTPISAAGIDSIRAVLNPPTTPYFFFVATGLDGSHIFSETWEEHKIYVQKLRDVEKANKQASR